MEEIGNLIEKSKSSTRGTHALNNNQAVARIDCAARASLTMYVRVRVRACVRVCV